MPNRMLVIVVVVSAVIARPAEGQPSSDWFYTQVGGLVGGAALFGLVRMGAAACGVGCDNDMPVGAEVMMAGVGGGLGALAGFAVDRLRRGGDPVIALSVGPSANYMTMKSSQVGGAATGGGLVAALQLSRFVSFHGEYATTRGTFVARPGSIDSAVLANVMPATSRSAGWSRGIEQIRSSWMFSEMIGIHPWTWSRVRMELLGGVAIHAQEKFSYYDATPGTYKVLNFASPDLGAVFGANAEIAVARHLAVVPMVRYYTRLEPGPSMSYAVGALYRY
ncbi:MAG TPA: hypothetical protein VJ691_14040 [Vicinamibacterales bacterium]|nr:hypothetical protein [Vicinamibacterales bacterium]